MAKAKKAPLPKAAAPAPNLFASAAKTASKSAPKSKGTQFLLPREVGDDGKLSEKDRILHQALTDVNKAHEEEKTAKNKGNNAKGILGGWVIGEYCSRYAKLGTNPETPITILNNKNEAVTYVLQDKAGQNALDEDKVALLEDFLGYETAHANIVNRKSYAFNPETLSQDSFEETTIFDDDGKPVTVKRSVQEIVFDVVSAAIVSDPRLSDEQKQNLITCTEKTYLRSGLLSRLTTVCGDSATKIERFFDIVGSAIVKYIKAS